MIAKGNLHANGAKLLNYLLTGERGERVEFGGARGFELFGPDLEDAAGIMQQMAEATTRCEKPWFHTQTRLAPGEQLTPEQWEQVLDREEKRLGFAGQPRAWSFHIDEATGERHMHAAWYRIDAETQTAIDPGLFKLRLMEVARGCELEFALREVSNHREPHDRARAAGRNEEEESRRLGTDVRAIRTAILDCYEQSDSGKAFKAALESQGLMLANGDRRDCFVVVDAEGGHHALNKKLTGHTLKQTRERLSDLDRAQLPSVEQAQALQGAQRPREGPAPQAAPDAQPTHQGRYDALRPIELPPDVARVFGAEAGRTTEPGIFDRDAANRDADAKIEAAAIASAMAREARPERTATAEIDRPAARGPYAEFPTPQPASVPERPLSRTEGDIRMAWTLSRSTEQLDEALASHGISLAAVSADEARQSDRVAAFAKEIGNFARPLREGEVVAVDSHSTVYRLTERTTGQESGEIEKRLGLIDRLDLLTVSNAKAAMREANREAWRDADRQWRDMERPLTGIETMIAEALTSTMTGTEFAAAIDKAGLTIVRATEADHLALNALRQDEQLARLAAEVNGEARQQHHFADVQPGELAAVSRSGDVVRLNPTALDWEEVEQRLADTQSRMPGVVEVRAAQEINRERTAELWEQRRAENAAAREAFQDKQELRAMAAAAERGVHAGFETAASAVDQAGGIIGGMLGGLARGVEKALSGIFDFFGGGGPKLTPQQAEAEAQDAQARAEARARTAAERQKDAEYDWASFARNRQEQQDDLNRSQQFGGPATREANTGHENDRREREKDRGELER